MRLLKPRMPRLPLARAALQRAVWRLAALALLCASAVHAAHAAHAITDDRGRTVRFETPPQRVVSLLPSLTESVCALGACARLVGVDRFSNWPASLAALPRVGGGLDPDIEAIVALRPDVVLLSTASRVADRLQALGVRVALLETRNQAEVRRTLGKLAALLALPEGEAARVWRHIDAGVQAAAQSLPARARGARVFFEVSPGPYAAGAGSFIGEILARLGARNAVPATLGPFPRLSPEYVLRADPDVLMATRRSPLAASGGYPGWQRMRALREGRLCVFTAEETDVIVRPGPRMAEAARLMARCLADKAP
ncbi:MAG: helical backbone metal receptor [Comamonadaceae bacterium]|nr:helical backbone metal receptor [Comamonadaceae bacterium]